MDKLIWGRFTEGEGGILAMMRIAEKHGARLTMFTDLAEVGLYGDAMIEVAQEIDRRGHDLELHCHPEFMPGQVWDEVGIRQLRLLNDASPEQAEATVKYLLAAYAQASTKSPVAFRGGSYRFNSALLRALAKAGVMIDSSYNPSKPKQSRVHELRAAFNWSNGVLELPISCLPDYNGAPDLTDFNFNVGRLSTAEKMLDFLTKFHAAYPGEIAVLVMHSWSFSKPSGSDVVHYDLWREDEVVRFSRFLELVAGYADVVTTRDVAATEMGSLATYDLSEVD
ncbi:MAG: hypothetical protein M9932_17785 [Xanthobacteraceae bacterium]|nr:hypothetical protein [Xanthobacteraceae bacterium]